MTLLRTRAAAAGLAVTLALITTGTVVASTQKATEERLTCQCGCGLTVHTCNHLQCSFAVPVREEIAASLSAGQSTETIIARYVEEYGEKVLSSPTTKGFNLLAWWGPYIALMLGAGALVLAFRRVGRRAALQSAEPPHAGASLSDGDRDRLARELEDLDK